MIVKCIATNDTSAEWFSPPFPKLDGDTLSVPGSTMAQKIGFTIGDSRGIIVEGRKYLVSRGQISESGGFFVVVEEASGETSVSR